MLRLEQEIREKGWSFSETSHQSGVNQVTIGQIVAGRFVPYPVQLEKLARALGFEGEPAQLIEEVEDAGA